MRTFAILARSGFYATCIGIAGQAVLTVYPMTYYMGKLIEKGILACWIAGFALSLLAVVNGRSERIRFGDGRSFYILAGLAVIASGYLLADSCLVLLRRSLWRFGISI